MSSYQLIHLMPFCQIIELARILLLVKRILDDHPRHAFIGALFLTH